MCLPRVEEARLAARDQEVIMVLLESTGSLVIYHFNLAYRLRFLSEFLPLAKADLSPRRSNSPRLIYVPATQMKYKWDRE